jgi:hypothetical protein
LHETIQKTINPYNQSSLILPNIGISNLASQTIIGTDLSKIFENQQLQIKMLTQSIPNLLNNSIFKPNLYFDTSTIFPDLPKILANLPAQKKQTKKQKLIVQACEKYEELTIKCLENYKYPFLLGELWVSEAETILLNLYLEKTPQDIDKTVLKIIKSSKWEFLDTVISSVSKNSLFEKQLPHIQEAFNFIKNHKISTNFIIPNLISLIESMIKAVLNSPDSKYQRKNLDKIKNNQHENLTVKNFLKNIIDNILFEDSILPSHTDNFNRHKILHGEELDYKKSSNLIRCILIIHVLSKIEQKI